MTARLRKFGAFYLYGVAMFAIGASAGAVLGLCISQAVFVTMLRQRGLL